jgi:hypothetical protein
MSDSQARDSSSDQQKNRIPAKAGRESENEGQQTLTTPNAPVLTGESQTPTRQGSGHDSSYWPPSSDWALVYVTIILAWFTFWLWRSTRNLVRDSRLSTMVAQRAFVFWIDYQETRTEEPGTTILLFKWKNSGATPTRRLIHHVNWQPFDSKGIPDNFTFPDTADTKSANGFFGPKAVHYALPIDIPQERIIAASEGRCRIFIWGWAEYNDVFGGTERHRTEFCSVSLLRASARLKSPRRSFHSSASTVRTRIA